MHRPRWFCTRGLWLLVVGVLGWYALAAAQPDSQLLSGDIWQTMSPDAKVAYILGIGNLIDFEYAVTDAPPRAQRSFLPWFVQGLRGRPINEVIERINVYYQEHPEQRHRPVVEVVLRATVLPRLLILQADESAR